MTSKSVRCAIYTRKSSEEGLDQSFNSLEAQREACQSFILSQKHEGWIALKSQYDDGGFSGGTMERPALQQLLGDIKDGNVDTVVVYKVDRLTRSLADFAKMIELFDSKSISFVSVTQQFSTTTSMGRLTLNVLLSFAQFEREIAGERIRDKIAASKKKGMWMGGIVPLGYDCVDRRLVVNSVESNTIRTIFRQYLRLGCVSKLKRFLEDKGIRSKTLTSSDGRMYGGSVYSRGALYHLLNNRVYIGETVHGNESYKGQHPAIVSQELWRQVAASLQKNNQAHRADGSRSTPSLLSGKLFDENGVRFTPTHAVKNGKRYRYYTSQTVVRQTGTKPAIARFPAQELEQFVMSQIHLLLQAPDKCTAGIKDSSQRAAARKKVNDLAQEWLKLEVSKRYEFVGKILRRTTVAERTVQIEIDRTELLATAVAGICKAAPLKVSSNFQSLRRGGEIRVIAPHPGSSYERTPVPSLVKVVARARDWHEQIIAGEIASIDQLAQKSGLTRRYVRKILRCATFSPQITEALSTGRHRPNLTVKEILGGMPLDWKEQEKRMFQAF